MARLTIHGARGSHPIAGRAFCRYGGHTPCVSLTAGRDLIVFDGGTGLRPLGEALMARPLVPPITIFFTHFHLDHVIGLPAFKPFYRQGTRVTLVGDPKARAWRDAVKTLTRPPLWPVSPFRTGAAVRFKNLPGTGTMRIGRVVISWCPVWHPQRCLSFRIETPTRTVVLATDREHGRQPWDRRFLEFCRGVDVLIHDAQYTPGEFPGRRGWGHSSWEQAASVARAVGARQLILTSHDPGRTDSQIDAIVRRARTMFRNTRAAAEHLMVEV